MKSEDTYGDPDNEFDEAAYDADEFANIGDYLGAATQNITAKKESSRNTVNKSPQPQATARKQRYFV